MRYLILFMCFIFFAIEVQAANPQAVQQLETVEEPDQADEMVDAPHANTPSTVKPTATMDNDIEKAIEEETRTMQQEPEKQEKPPEKGLKPGYNKVTLQVLNKVTARAVQLELETGTHTRFGTLEITVRSCWKSAPEAKEEQAALLEVYEFKAEKAPEKLFVGWIFSSSPALSALEHPFYDITLKKCEKTTAEEKKPNESRKPF